jgi:hypothetical protein
LSSYTDWPGRVIVIEHTLGPDEKFYSLYGHLRYPTGKDPLRDPEAEDPWALPVFGTIGGGSPRQGFRNPGDPPLYVRRGQQIGTVMNYWRGTDLSNSHLHFEIRTQETAGKVGNCQGIGYTKVVQNDEDPRSVEEWLEEEYYWLNPVDFIYEHGRSAGLALLTDSHTRVDARTEPSDDGGDLGNLGTESRLRGSKRQKESDGDWWYRVPIVEGWIKAYKKNARESEILVGEVPDAPRRGSTVVTYSYSYGDLSGKARVLHGDTFTIWNALGGCGPPVFSDTALCLVSRGGQVRAYNHDCQSEYGRGTFGEWVSQDCSVAKEFGYEVECCVEP